MKEKEKKKEKRERERKRDWESERGLTEQNEIERYKEIMNYNT